MTSVRRQKLQELYFKNYKICEVNGAITIENCSATGAFTYKSNSQLIKNYDFIVKPGGGPIVNIFSIEITRDCNVVIEVDCFIKTDTINKYTHDLHDIVCRCAVKNEYVKYLNKCVDFMIVDNVITYYIAQSETEQLVTLKVDIRGFRNDIDAISVLII